MALALREATVTWSGTIGSGEGTLRTGGDAVQAVPVDWNARSAEAGGTTSPEELLAAAEASCYAMTLALTLQRNGTPADRLEVRGACTLDRVEGAAEYAITGLSLDVEGRVEGLDAKLFEQLAAQADRECPVSNAVRGTVPVRLSARLTG